MNRNERRIRLDAGAHAGLGIVGAQFGSIRQRFDQRAMLVARKNDARVFRKIWGRRKDLPFQDFRQNVGYAQRIPYSNRNMMNHRLVSPSLTCLSCRLPCSGMTPKFTVFVFWVGSGHIDTRHHAVIFVFEIVTMEQVTPTITAPLYDDVDILSFVDRDCVLPSTLMAERRAAIAAENLKRREVRVNWMEHGKYAEETAVHESPHFHFAQSRIGVDARRIKSLAIDDPLYARRHAPPRLPPEDKSSHPGCARGLQRLEFRKDIRHAAVVSLCPYNVEAHYATQGTSGALVL